MAATATANATGTYNVDITHSEVTFQVRHLITRVRGRFTDFDGVIDFDGARPEASSVRLSIRAASIDTGTADRDTHLRSDDFFAADRFPALTFESRAVTPRGGDQYEVTGDLTIRDVTKQIVVPVTYLGQAADPWGGQRLALEGSATINRKDFGLNWNAALETGGFLVGDEVQIAISIQAVRQTS